MGKKIIIKGADFSLDGIENNEVLIIDRSSVFSFSENESIISESCFVDKDYQLLQGRFLSSVEFKCSSVGNVSIVKMKTNMSSNYEVVRTITINQNDVGLIKKFDVSIPIGNDEIIGILATDDTGKFYYCIDLSVLNYGFYYHCGTNRTVLDIDTQTLSVNWYIQN